MRLRLTGHPPHGPATPVPGRDRRRPGAAEPFPLREQITRLRELNQLDHIDIRVMPWDAGSHTAMHIGGFAILDFPDTDDPAVVYLESHTFARYLEEPKELTEYRMIFESVYRKAVSVEEFR
jgi:Domain of unknown function (DUF5753)